MKTLEIDFMKHVEFFPVVKIIKHNPKKPFFTVALWWKKLLVASANVFGTN